MRIACPNCAAEYEVPESLLAAGPRLLRCARCAHQFTIGAPAAPPLRDSEPSAEATAAPAPRTERAWPPPRPSLPPAPPPYQALDPDRPPPTRGPDHHSPIEPEEALPDRLRLLLAWLLSIAVIGGACLAAYLWRAEIMQAWPPTRHLFATLGLA